MKKIIRGGEAIPRFYGLAYVDYHAHNAVCYPVPLNIVVRLGRKLWLRIKNPRHTSCYECAEATRLERERCIKAIQDNHACAYNDGFNCPCIIQAIRVIKI